MFPCIRQWRGNVLVCCSVTLGSMTLGAGGQVLFEANRQTLPGNQGWTYVAVGAATQAITDEALLFDTSAVNPTQAGYSLISPVRLNRTNGFTLVFTAQVLQESHANTNRAGFSLIVLDEEKWGVELGFWIDRAFAQSDSPLFAHAEEGATPAIAALITYTLSILPTNYSLRADGQNILSGPLRNYTAFNGFPNPYRTANFLFMGDNTTSASATVRVGEVLLLTPPTLDGNASGVVEWEGVPGARYVVQTSSDCKNWADAAEVESASGKYSYTSTIGGETTFLRVRLP